MEFKEYKLSELSKGNKGTYGIGASAVDYSEDLYTYLRITDIKEDGTLDYANLKSVDDENAYKYILEKGDIVFARTGNSTGKSYYYDSEIENLVYAGFLIKFSLDETKVNSKFIKYYTFTNEYKNWVKEIQTGSTRGNINEKMYGNMIIKLPPREYQDKMVALLDKIDKKIELSNQIINNLFEIIKQYIKEKYYYNTSIKVSKINKLGKIQCGYAFKSKDLTDETTNNKIFKIKNISSNGIDINNTQYIYDETADTVDKKFLLNRGDVIVAMTGAELGKTGYLFGNGNRYFLNQRVGVIRGNNETNNLYLNCVFLLEEMQSLLNLKGYGSAQPNISSNDIEQIEIPIPNEYELQKFYDFVKPIYEHLILNSEQNHKLKQLRNTLLPKLMNGEINLSKIEI